MLEAIGREKIGQVESEAIWRSIESDPLSQAGDNQTSNRPVGRMAPVEVNNRVRTAQIGS